MSQIAENLLRVRERMAEAARRVGRDPSEVELLAVSKRFPASAIREAWEAGQRRFGENYAQELARKAEELKGLEGLELHFIGTLQRNKAKYVAAHAASCGALDDLGAAAELGRRAALLGRSIELFIEVNLGESQKGGVAPEALAPFLDALRKIEGLCPIGLMAIPPAEEPERVRPYFRRVALLAREHGLAQLSMGMSGDFEVAIEEGSTLVRVGSSIFGERSPR